MRWSIRVQQKSMRSSLSTTPLLFLLLSSVALSLPQPREDIEEFHVTSGLLFLPGKEESDVVARNFPLP